MESLIPALVGGAELDLLTDLLPVGAPVLLADPERIRTRSADLVRTGQEFLEASWFTAAASAATRRSTWAPSAYRGLDEVLEHAASTGRPVVTLSPLVSGRDDVFAPAVHEVESYRGDTDRALTDLRAHVADRAASPCSSSPAPARPSARSSSCATRTCRPSSSSGCRPRRSPASSPSPAAASTARASATGGGLVLLTEADLTGNRAPRPRTRARWAAKRRRNAVDLVTLSPGDYVVHAQHGIGRFVEMRERTVSGATREYLVLEYGSSQARPARRPAVRARRTRWTRSAATSAARCPR